jgi:hypothetical protein
MQMDVIPLRRSENPLGLLMLEFTDQLLKLISFIPVPQFPRDYMRITTLDITIHGRYLRAVMGSSG